MSRKLRAAMLKRVKIRGVKELASRLLRAELRSLIGDLVNEGEG
jgi:hypothetical protein